MSTGDIGNDGTWAMPAGSGPCRTWPLMPGCGCLAPGSTTHAWEGAATWTDEQTNAVEAATEILWRLTAGQFGLCAETIRPCKRCACEPCENGIGFHPELSGGEWFNARCGSCGRTGDCGCPGLPEIRLPGPVHWEPLARPAHWDSRWRPHDRPPDDPNSPTPRYRLIVWVDGHTLMEPGWPVEWSPGEPIPEQYTPARGEYWLYGDNRLVRTDGQEWPACQDLSRPIQAREQYPDEALGTFGVQYWRGTPVPPGGRRAVSILACELWKACIDDATCRLPRGVQSITREGVQYTMMEQQSKLLDYLPDVSGWVQAVNPRDQRQASAVFSPDLPKSRSEWTTGGRVTRW